MPRPFIEHVNLTVSDPARTAAMLGAIFGWEERWHGPAQSGGWTVHIGSPDCYLALYTPPEEEGEVPRYPKGEPLNHVGIEVDDLTSVEAKVAAHGLRPFAHGDYAPGKRFYFLDFDGIEYEVVSYSS